MLAAKATRTHTNHQMRGVVTHRWGIHEPVTRRMYSPMCGTMNPKPLEIELEKPLIVAESGPPISMNEIQPATEHRQH